MDDGDLNHRDLFEIHPGLQDSAAPAGPIIPPWSRVPRSIAINVRRATRWMGAVCKEAISVGCGLDAGALDDPLSLIRIVLRGAECSNEGRTNSAGHARVRVAALVMGSLQPC